MTNSPVKMTAMAYRFQVGVGAFVASIIVRSESVRSVGGAAGVEDPGG
jgi:hypothetical protein